MNDILRGIPTEQGLKHSSVHVSIMLCVILRGIPTEQGLKLQHHKVKIGIILGILRGIPTEQGLKLFKLGLIEEARFVFSEVFQQNKD